MWAWKRRRRRSRPVASDPLQGAPAAAGAPTARAEESWPFLSRHALTRAGYELTGVGSLVDRGGPVAPSREPRARFKTSSSKQTCVGARGSLRETPWFSCCPHPLLVATSCVEDGGYRPAIDLETKSRGGCASVECDQSEIQTPSTSTSQQKCFAREKEATDHVSTQADQSPLPSEG